MTKGLPGNYPLGQYDKLTKLPEGTTYVSEESVPEQTATPR